MHSKPENPVIITKLQTQINNTTVNKQQQHHLQETGFGCLLGHHHAIHGSINYIRNYTMCHYQEINRDQKQLKSKIGEEISTLTKPIKTVHVDNKRWKQLK
jgi:hypothetical protein